MSTLLLAPALFASDGGIERMMRLYLKALGELAGPADTVVAAALNDTSPDHPGFTRYGSPALCRRIMGNRARVRFGLRVLLAARRCDRMVCGHLHLWPLVALARKVRPGLRGILVAHGIEVWNPWPARTSGSVAAFGEVLAVSAFTRDRVRERCPGLPPERLAVVPNALDPEVTRDRSIAPTPGRIVTLSRLNQSDNYKGIDHLIAALPAVTRAVPDAHLWVIGTGDDRPRLEALARQQAPGRVQFAGFVPDAELGGWLGTAQVFALPSRDEGFGLVYLEALAHGRPCIAARAGGAPEVVDPGSGRLVPYGDVAALADACIDALRTPWDPARLRDRAGRFSYPVFRDNLARWLDRRAAPEPLAA